MHRTERTNATMALALLALVGCGGAGDGLAEDGGGIESGGPAVTLAFTAGAPEGDFQGEQAFELGTTDSIRVVADFANVGADGAARLELRRPSGLVWYATVIPFTGATGSDRSVSALEGGGYRVVYLLEVAGTPIEQFQMTGTWSATTTLDGTATGASASFQLQ